MKSQQQKANSRGYICGVVFSYSITLLVTILIGLSMGYNLNTPSVPTTTITTVPNITDTNINPYVPISPSISDENATQYVERYNLHGDSSIAGVFETSDGGFIVGGNVEKGSNNGEYRNIFLVKHKWDGDIEWAKRYGGDMNNVRAFSIIMTTDGGFVAIGASDAYTDDYGILIVKFDGDGSVQWARVIDVPGNDYGKAIIQTSDGGYAVTGVIQEDESGRHKKIFLLKLDQDGNFKWMTSMAEEFTFANITTIIQAPDGGFYLGGYRFNRNCSGFYQMIIYKLATNGILNWTRGYGCDHASNIVLVGASGGDLLAAGGKYILRLDQDGSVEWARGIQGMNFFPTAGLIGQNGGLTLLGNVLEENNIPRYISIFEMTPTSGFLWNKKFFESTYATAINKTSDGGYILGGKVFERPSWHVLFSKVTSRGSVKDCEEIQDNNATLEVANIDVERLNIEQAFLDASSVNILTPTLEELNARVTPSMDCSYNLKRQIKISIQGTGRGYVSVDPYGYICRITDGECSYSMEYGTKIILVPHPLEGTEFIGWRGCECANYDEQTNGCEFGNSTREANCTATFRKTENLPPQILNFTVDKTSGAPGLEVKFFCSAIDEDGEISEFRFDFDGDGEIDSTAEVFSNQVTTHYTYVEAGHYSPTIQAVDNEGAIAQAGPLSITVTEPTQNQAPQGEAESHDQGNENAPQAQQVETETSNQGGNGTQVETANDSSNTTESTSDALLSNQYFISLKSYECSSGTCTEKSAFSKGERIKLMLCIEARPQQPSDFTVDEYIAILTPAQTIYFLTGNPFSPLAQYQGGDIGPYLAYNAGLTDLSGCFKIFEFEVPQDLYGVFTVFGALGTSGENLGVFTLRSNVASRDLNFRQ